MTDILDDQSRKDLVAYRIERAHKTLEEVNVLLENGLLSTAVNRLYYAVYYAAIALMVKDGFTPNTHAGVRSLLGLHYIRTGKITRDIGSNYAILFERRQRCDYDDFIESTYEEITNLVPLAESFIGVIDDLVK